MKIGQITYTYQPITGGGDVYVSLLEQVLGESGNELRVYQRPAPVADPHLRFLSNPLARFKRGEFWTQALFLGTQKEALLAEEVLIAHYPIYLLAAARLRRGRERPRLIGISHGVTWDDGRLLASRIKRIIARRAYRRADGFVANDSYFLREMGLAIAPRQGLFSEVTKNRWFIPNSIPPLPQIGRAVAELRSLKAIIVPRNFYYNRGIHLAVEAFRDFSSKYPDTHLVVIGAKSQPGYTRQVEERVKQLGLESRVIFWGHVAHEAMEDFYASAELCLIPSLCGEGTSLSALESMSYGLATITTDIAGLRDLPGIQCRPQAAALAETLMQTFPKRKEIGARQQTEVGRDYSFERWAQSWRKVIG
jgi:glycosyltransferase involved in cell wall biosynthesis